jgi:hypothetical protein
MKQHPVYLATILLAAGYLLLANLRGWSLVQSVARSAVFRGPAGSSFSHK